MLNPKTNERELAYIVKVSETNELPGYDSVHSVRVLGWQCVASKDVKEGDLAVYFEIDSLLPKDDQRFAFMEKRKFVVKTIKICKTVSQGLVLPLTSFPELKNCKEGDFVTDKLHVEKYDPEPVQENKPKKKVSDFQRAMGRHKKFFKNPVIKYLMKYKPIRLILSKLFVHKKDKAKCKWPEWLPKTGSERIQNIPGLLGSDDIYIITEKCIDGSSLIRTIDGMISISKLVNNKINTLVASYNESKGIIEYKRILNYHRVKQDNKKEQFKLGIKHIGKGNKQKYIKCTEDHKLLTPDGWKNAADLQVGDVVYHYVDSIAKTVIVSKEILKKKQRYMFDIEVEDNHNYFAQSVLVHNCDGASTSFVLDEKNNYFVCSHNVVKNPEEGSDGGNYYKNNIWAESGAKYNMEELLKSLKTVHGLKTVAIQGETYGDKVQKRNYSLKNNEHDFVVFHIWFDGKRLPIKEMIKICEDRNLPHVHVYDYEYKIPSSIEEIIDYVDSCKSAIDGGDIEGFVFYSQDGQNNFKCVSPNFLLKYHR